MCVCVYVFVCMCGREGKRTVGPGATPVLCWSAAGLSQMQGQLPLEAWQATSHFLSTVRLPTGVLLDVQKFFQISDSNAGLLQTGKEGIPSLGPWAHAGWGSFSRSCSVSISSCWEMGARLSLTESLGTEDGWYSGGREKEAAQAEIWCLHSLLGFEGRSCGRSSGSRGWKRLPSGVAHLSFTSVKLSFVAGVENF